MNTQKNIYTATQIAAEFGWSAKKLNKFLEEKGVIVSHKDNYDPKKQKLVWRLTSDYQGKGYTTLVEITGRKTEWKREPNLEWTDEGAKFIRELVYSHLEGLNFEKQDVNEGDLLSTCAIRMYKRRPIEYVPDYYVNVIQLFTFNRRDEWVAHNESCYRQLTVKEANEFKNDCAKTAFTFKWPATKNGNTAYGCVQEYDKELFDKWCKLFEI